MSYHELCFAVPAEHCPAANTVAVAVFTEADSITFDRVGLSADGTGEPTHYWARLLCTTKQLEDLIELIPSVPAFASWWLEGGALYEANPPQFLQRDGQSIQGLPITEAQILADAGLQRITVEMGI